MSNRDKKGKFKATHGMTDTKIYGCWCSMKERCGNPNNKSYKRYGARGIRVCEEWMDFKSFYDWARNNGYKEGLTIDRINNNGNYEPSNCRWTTTKEQNRNYSRNHMITYKGETKCLADWADQFGINRATVLFRIKQNMKLEEVFYKGDRRELRWKTKIIL